MKKRMIITGAEGFLGSKIVKYYQTDHEVIPVNRQAMDITDYNSVVRIFQQHRPDIVIHCAAISDTGQCEREPQSSYVTNVTGSVNVARACKTYESKLVSCSSDQIYCASEMKEPHTETEIIIPNKVYGKQKLEAEQKISEILSDAVHLRLSWMYDKEEKGLLKNVLQAARANQTAFYSANDYRGVTNVWEVVRNLEAAMNLPGGVYNFGSENNGAGSLYDLAQFILRKSGYSEKLALKDKQSFNEKPRNLQMNIDKLKAFGIQFAIVCEGLAQAMAN